MGLYVMEGMARQGVLSILIALLLLPGFATTISASSGSMVTAGSGGVAVIGLPGHQGDTVTFSTLIHNEGEVSGTVFLSLNSSNQTYFGEEVVIEPGSSREVLALFPLSGIGLIDVFWEVLSNDSSVSENLSGTSQISIDEPQDLNVEIVETVWTSADGLDVSFRTILSEGRSREVSIEIMGHSGSNSQLLQSFDSLLTPGIRHFSLSLGSPIISSVSIRAIPIEWVSSDFSYDEVSVTSPIISGDIEIISISPSVPTVGDSVSIDIRISNTGTDPINSGSVRIISSASGIVLAELTSPSVQSGSESLQTLSVGSWPEGNPVDIRAQWYSDILISEYDNSVISNNVVSSSTEEFPWIIIGIGSIIGLLLAIAIRSVNNGRNKSVSTKRSRKVEKTTKIKDKSEDKREVNCPECNRALLIPQSYSGRARCAPPCSTEFSVDIEKNQDEDTISETLEIVDDISSDDSLSESLISKSKEDLLDCPSCGQILKVPLSKRPVTARCPACRSEFEALEG